MQQTKSNSRAVIPGTIFKHTASLTQTLGKNTSMAVTSSARFTHTAAFLQPQPTNTHFKSCIYKHYFHTYGFYPAVTAQHSTHTHTHILISRAVISHYIHIHTYSFSPADTKDSLQRLYSQLLYSKEEKLSFYVFRMLLQSCLEHKMTSRMVKYQTLWLAENKGYQ